MPIRIPTKISRVMKMLEGLDSEERSASKPREKRLRQIPKEEGPVLTLLLTLAPEGIALEVGTSGGYSALWQLVALKRSNRRLITFEQRADMVDLARKTFKLTSANSHIDLIFGDAIDYLKQNNPKWIAWCFLDAEDSDLPCFNLIASSLLPGGLIVVDNAISHESQIREIEKTAHSIFKLETFTLAIGNGLLVCCKPSK